MSSPNDNLIDCAVIGLGAHGASTLFFLSKRNPQLSIVGIEKYTPGNQMGSSGGLSRIIRKAYFESPAYVRLLERSYELYKEVQEDAKAKELSYVSHPQHELFTPGHTLLHITGGLDIGPQGSSMVDGAILACVANGLDYEVLDPDQVAERWPITLPDPTYCAVFQRDGGFLEPEKTNFTMTMLAEQYTNTTNHYGTTVIDVELNSGGNFSIFMVPTTSLPQDYQKSIPTLKATATILIAKKIVLATGPWIQDTMNWTAFQTQRQQAIEDNNAKVQRTFAKLATFFSPSHTQVQRQVVNWHNVIPQPTNPTLHDSPNFPIFLIHHKHNYLESSPLSQSTTATTTSPSSSLTSQSINNTKIDKESGDLIVDPSNTTSIDDHTPFDHFYYGFPSMRTGDNSIKIGRYHHLHEDVHQDQLNRDVNFLDLMATSHVIPYFFPHLALPQWYSDCVQFLSENTDPKKTTDVEMVLRLAKEEEIKIGTSLFPQETSNITMSKTCTFTNVYDGHFLIEPMTLQTTTHNPTDSITTTNPNIIILSCCSGHGYKFNAVIGEICSDVITKGTSQFDIAWLGVDRIPLK